MYCASVPFLMRGCSSIESEPSASPRLDEACEQDVHLVEELRIGWLNARKYENILGGKLASFVIEEGYIYCSGSCSRSLPTIQVNCSSGSACPEDAPEVQLSRRNVRKSSIVY